MTWSALLLIVALILFVLSAIGINAPRVNLTALGLAFFAAYFLLATGTFPPS